MRCLNDQAYFQDKALLYKFLKIPFSLLPFIVKNGSGDCFKFWYNLPTSILLYCHSENLKVDVYIQFQYLLGEATLRSFTLKYP